mmetsp:Transcript_12991/g.39334  ORF Transcript_12991/g.39334 Transcript_12991/m.39334 type:complete len:203 (-) Transcript_12991:60-668(-)
MDSPDLVSRVTPPSTTMLATHAAEKPSQADTCLAAEWDRPAARLCCTAGNTAEAPPTAWAPCFVAVNAAAVHIRRHASIAAPPAAGAASAARCVCEAAKPRQAVVTPCCIINRDGPAEIMLPNVHERSPGLCMHCRTSSPSAAAWPAGPTRDLAASVLPCRTARSCCAHRSACCTRMGACHVDQRGLLSLGCTRHADHSERS